MAGIFDDVMDGIAAKEKGEQPQTATQEHTTPQEETSNNQEAPATEGNPMNTYSDDFKKQYGEKKK